MSSQAIQQPRRATQGISRTTIETAIDSMRTQRDQLNQSIAELENCAPTETAQGAGSGLPLSAAGATTGTPQAPVTRPTGKPLTTAQRRKISEAQKQRWAQKRAQQQRPKTMKAAG